MTEAEFWAEVADLLPERHGDGWRRRCRCRCLSLAPTVVLDRVHLRALVAQALDAFGQGGESRRGDGVRLAEHSDHDTTHGLPVHGEIEKYLRGDFGF